MSRPARRRASYADVLSAPEGMVAEIIDGDLYTTPRPAGPHTISHSALGMILGPPFQFGDGGPGGWWIFYEPELHLHEDVVVPDLAGWRKERMPRPPKDGRFVVVPDWVCEVLSSSTARIDRVKKTRVYAREAVGHMWLVDPVARTLEAYRLEKDRWLLLATHADDEIVEVEPFGDVAIDLLKLWGETRPAPER